MCSELEKQLIPCLSTCKESHLLHLPVFPLIYLFAHIPNLSHNQSLTLARSALRFVDNSSFSNSFKKDHDM